MAAASGKWRRALGSIMTGDCSELTIRLVPRSLPMRCCVEARFALCFIIFNAVWRAQIQSHPLLRFPSPRLYQKHPCGIITAFRPRATHAASFPAVAPLHHPHTTLSSSRVSSLILPSFRAFRSPGGLVSQSFVCILGAPREWLRLIRGSAIFHQRLGRHHLCLTRFARALLSGALPISLLPPPAAPSRRDRFVPPSPILHFALFAPRWVQHPPRIFLSLLR